VIPTVLLVGVLFGRWWKITVPVAVLGWPSLLIASGIDSGFQFALTAALLAAANVVVGVLGHQAVTVLFRRVASSTRHVTSEG
jgi:hypothetical protein